MGPYSFDLRVRAVTAYERGEGSYAELAKRYEICEATLRDWHRRYRSTGSFDPLPHSGGSRPVLTDEDRAHVVKADSERNDATLEELRDDLFAQRGVRVSGMTIWTILDRHGLTRKKRLGMRPSAKLQRGKPNGKPTNMK